LNGRVSVEELMPRFLSFVPALIFVIVCLPRLLYTLPNKKRRLLPLKDVPFTGKLLLICRTALALAFVGTSIALAIQWEDSNILGREYSGRAAWILEIVAAVSH
jgi:branched-subunit amino acid transport protein